MEINGVTVYHLFDVLAQLRPETDPWVLDSEEIEATAKTWCVATGSVYYSADPESFSTFDAVRVAKERGASSVLLAELHGVP